MNSTEAILRNLRILVKHFIRLKEKLKAGLVKPAEALA